MPRKRRSNVATSDQILVRVVAPKRSGTFVLKWVDASGNQRQRSTGLPAKRTLRRRAIELANELAEQLNEELANGDQIDWDGFCRRYRQEHLSGLAVATREAWATADNHFRNLVRPGLVGMVTADTLSRFVAGLRARGMAETSVDTYLRTINAALGWAAEIGVIDAPPKFRRPRRARAVGKSRRGRAPSREEVERIMSAAKRLRPNDGEKFADLVQALDLSGLRIGEAIRELSWDWSSRFSVMLEGPYPMYKILAEGEKGHTDRLLPMAPDFAEWLARTPERERRGRVFKFDLACSTIEKQITRFGRAAGVVISETGKCASAHDLRSAFGVRWAMRVKPPVLQVLMRHKSLQTTMKYYVHLDAQQVAQELHAVTNGGAYGGAPESGLDSSQAIRISKELQLQ